ncbi:MAG: hypothetical protein M1594_01115 [Candidatus Marsarchaeota archaeon]|nr:hypothetical protein [Candidatus Marsarchaeota archaeon]
MKFSNPYENKNYKKLIFIPLVLIIISLALVFFNGIPEGIDLKGGMLITFQTNATVNPQVLEQKLSSFSKTVAVTTFSAPSGNGVEVELENNPSLTKAESDLEQLQNLQTLYVSAEVNNTLSTTDLQNLRQQVLSQAQIVLNDVNSTASIGNSTSTALKVAQTAYSTALNNYGNNIISAINSSTPISTYSVNTVGATLSALFLTQARNIIIYAFILSAIVIFLIFRSFTPSSIVIIGAVSDILITLGGMSLLSIPLTLDSIAAILMLIGFSLDTDVLLTIKVLKREEGNIYERAFDAMKTGFMMNITTIGAFAVLLAVGLIFQIPAYYEIGAVACIGGLADFVATWGLNAVMVLNHAEKTKKI